MYRFIRFCLFFIFIIRSGLIWGQDRVVESQVVDSNSGQPLISANVYTNEGYGTITNSEGCFALYAPTDGIIKVSYLGYETGIFHTDSMGEVIALRPISYDIKPAVVLSVDGNALVSAIFEKYKPIAYDNGTFRSTYFFRQTTFEYGKCSELVEAIFDARSTICLRDISLEKGRYATLPQDTTTSYNTFPAFYNLSQISFFSPKKVDKRTVMIPVSPESSKYYDISLDLMMGDNDEDVYVIHFAPKTAVKRPILGGDLYVTADTYKVLRFKGQFNCPTVIKETKEDVVINIHFTIDYSYEDTVPLVNNVVMSTQYEYTNLFGENSVCRVHSILTKMDTDMVFNGKRHPLKERSHLLGKITTLEEDEEFWKNNPIIKRTPLEEEAIIMFRNENLIGNYQVH